MSSNETIPREISMDGSDNSCVSRWWRHYFSFHPFGGCEKIENWIRKILRQSSQKKKTKKQKTKNKKNGWIKEKKKPSEKKKLEKKRFWMSFIIIPMPPPLKPRCWWWWIVQDVCWLDIPRAVRRPRLIIGGIYELNATTTIKIKKPNL